MKIFLNRTGELENLERNARTLTVLFGRRRVGKTSLIERWGQGKNLYYSQAIEGAEGLQVGQIMADLADLLPEGLVARNWNELLAIFATVTQPCIVVIDEFPYLVKIQASLPSLLQNWLDHKRPRQMQLVLLGSSQTMMNSLFLDATAPLYHRAELILHLEPMSYKYFAQFLGRDPSHPVTFELFSLVGGTPEYWKHIRGDEDQVKNADRLYFQKAAMMENEPDRLLKDEDLHGYQAKSILESIGRGVSKSSEIAGRMGIPQTALAKPMKLLLHTSLVQRSLPFGESLRSTKKTLYSIGDPALKFWYGSFSPHRSRWHLYEKAQKTKIIHDHASQVLEANYRQSFPDGLRYWENNIEFDCVRFQDGLGKNLIVSEIKHRRLGSAERKKIAGEISAAFAMSKLSREYRLGKVEVLDTSDVLSHLV
jgi:AAA+ ATPase superfamily predicted ATPase